MAKATPKPPKPAKPDAPAKPGGKRTDFDKVNSPDEAVYPFKVAVPEGYNFAEHKPLKKRDFVEDWFYYEHRAAELEFKAANFRAQAEEAQKLGSTKQRSKAKRLIKLRSQIAELTATLAAQGIDVKALLEDESEAA